MSSQVPFNSASVPTGIKHRPRKERCQNWQVVETLVLIDAKRMEHDDEKKMINKCALMAPEVNE